MIPAWPWLAVAVLLIVTFLVYIPVIRGGGFIWDDDVYVTGNLRLLSVQGLRDIWTKVGPMRGGTAQYYPVTFSTFWAEYHLWKLQPLGYHTVNILLHALNAVMVWRILRFLSVPGALFAAVIFAVHPVHVESVAWITERKNILSGFFYLLSFLCCLRFMDIPGAELPFPGGSVLRVPGQIADKSRGRRCFYFFAIVLFLCALASKTVTASLPAVILLMLWWKTGRIGWKNLALTAPMFILGAGSGLLTAHIEKYQVGASGYEWVLTPVEHCLLAGRIPWFYVGKLIWPWKLMFIYPRWEVDQAVWWQYLFPLAVIAVLVLLWSAREKIGRGPLTAVLFFGGTLVPVLGFFNVYPMRFSYVADHFQYLASLGPIALFSAGVTWGCVWIKSWPRPGLAARAVTPAAGLLLLTLGLLTWRQGGIYKNSDQIWIDTIKKNPACWLAHGNLGVAIAAQGKTREAIAHYRAALLIRPGSETAHANLGLALAGQGKVDEAIAHYLEALRIKPNYLEGHVNCAEALAGQGKLDEAIAHYRAALLIKPDYAEIYNNIGMALSRQGKLDEAIAHYRAALRIRPDYAEAHNNLAVRLAAQGKVEEAAAHYGEALRIKPDSAEIHYNWGVTLAERGKVEEAITHYHEALRINPDYAKVHYTWGLTLFGQGRLEEAVAHYREALRIKPDYAEVQNNWGILLASAGRLDEAIQHFREALKITPNNSNVQKNLDLVSELKRNSRSQ